MSATQCGNSILTFHAYTSVILKWVNVLKLYLKEAKVQWYHIRFNKFYNLHWQYKIHLYHVIKERECSEIVIAGVKILGTHTVE